MFYCDNCATTNEWPSSMVKSSGRCEICKTNQLCNDTPSKLLPVPLWAREKYGVDEKGDPV